MSTLKFIPPQEEAKGLPRYASYVVGSGMKLHDGVGYAKASFNNRGWKREVNPDWKEGDSWYGKWKNVTKQSYILENVNGEWYVLYEIPEGITKNDLPWVKKYFRDTKYTYFSWYRFDTAGTSTLENMKATPDRFVYEYRVTAMTVDEYVDWRLKVQREQILGSSEHGASF